MILILFYLLLYAFIGLGDISGDPKIMETVNRFHGPCLFVLLGTKVVLAANELSILKNSFLPSLKCSPNPLFRYGFGEPSFFRKVDIYTFVV